MVENGSGVIEKALASYAAIRLPEIGVQVEIGIPLPTGSEGGSGKTESLTTGARPEEDAMMSNWSILLTVKKLSLRNILHLFTFMVLERQIVVMSENLGFFHSFFPCLSPDVI